MESAGWGWGATGSPVLQGPLGSERVFHSLPCELSKCGGTRGVLCATRLGPCPRCSHGVPV